MSDTGGGGDPKLLIRVPIAVRWRDLDAFEHVNNSNFLTFLEEARLQWFDTLPGWMDAQVAPLLAQAHIDYRRPIPWPASVLVELRAQRLGNSSITIAHRIVDGNDDTVLYADGHSVLVWIDRGSGRPTPLPDCIRSAAS